MVIRDAEIHAKDAFWNSEDVTVYDSEIDGEFLGWHTKRLKLVNCRIKALSRFAMQRIWCLKTARWIPTAISDLSIPP